MTNSFAAMGSWLPTALCRDYFSAHFDEQRVQVLEADGAVRDEMVTWAVGLLRGGDWEVLGAWPGVARVPVFWRGVWEELDHRGVERLTLVSATNLDTLTPCPAAVVLPPFRLMLGERNVPDASGVAVLRSEARSVVRNASGARAARIALERLLGRSGRGGGAVLSLDWPAVLERFRAFYALRPQRRALVRKGDEVVEHLSGTLNRAVVRHGAFAIAEAATSFVASTLARAEQRLKYRDLVELTSRRHAAGPAGASFAVRGP